MYAIGVHGAIGLMITALQRNVLRPWHHTADNWQSKLNRWIAFGVMGILLDIVALVSPIYLVWDIQMDRRTKSTVVLAFAFRAPTIAFTVLRLVALSTLSGHDFTWAYVVPEIYTQLEMHYSLIAATIPCLRIFLKAWHTRFLNMALEELDEQAYVERRCSPDLLILYSSLLSECKMLLASRRSTALTKSASRRHCSQRLVRYGFCRQKQVKKQRMWNRDEVHHATGQRTMGNEEELRDFEGYGGRRWTRRRRCERELAEGDCGEAYGRCRYRAGR